MHGDVIDYTCAHVCAINQINSFAYVHRIAIRIPRTALGLAIYYNRKEIGCHVVKRQCVANLDT